MTNDRPTRRNIKVDPEIHERLKEHKKRMETWAGFFERVLDDLED